MADGVAFLVHKAKDIDCTCGASDLRKKNGHPLRSKQIQKKGGGYVLAFFVCSLLQWGSASLEVHQKTWIRFWTNVFWLCDPNIWVSRRHDPNPNISKVFRASRFERS